VYAAAVVLPPPPQFDHSKMKDSKRFHSIVKIREAAAYIKENALAWSVRWESEESIDRMNIRNATHHAMHAAIHDVLAHDSVSVSSQAGAPLLVVDGNDFTPFSRPTMRASEHDMLSLERVPHVCVEGGDNKFSMIAAASILAKVARDEYIEELCVAHPQLVERYDLHKNKGYGAKRHMDGIAVHGISKWHRRSFGVCKTAPLAEIE
jgi:ribonuclease HII